MDIKFLVTVSKQGLHPLFAGLADRVCVYMCTDSEKVLPRTSEIFHTATVVGVAFVICLFFSRDFWEVL